MKKIILMMVVTLSMAMAILCGCDNTKQENCEHDFDVWYTTVAPTCETDGEETSTCTICGTKEIRAVGKLNHDWQIVSDTTNCLTAGEIVYVCGNDRNHTYTEKKDALGHDWKDGKVIEAATCEHEGRRAPSYCDRCGEVSEFEVVIPALDHLYDEGVVTKPATCTTDGSAIKTCLREGCGHTETVTVPQTGHDYVEQSRTDATCLDSGSIHYVCSHDSTHTKDEPIQALGHDWEMGSVTKAATCTTPGEAASAKCRRCNITQDTVEIPALGHDMQLQSTESMPNSSPGQSVCGGKIEKWKCSRCDHTETKEVTGTEHKFLGGWFYRKPATCQIEGEKYRTCSVCGYTETEAIPKIDHDYTRIEYIEKPTCEQPGKMKIQCRMCGGYKTGQEEVAPATGHDWKELCVSALPTCKEQGKGKHECLTCHKQEEYNIEKRDHVYGDFVIDKDSNNTMSRHCVYCGTKSETKSIPRATNNKVEFELRLRRTNCMPYSPHEKGTGYDNLKYEIYNGTQLLETIEVKKDTFTHSISTSAKKLKVVGLPEGFTSVQEEYDLDSTKPLVTIEVKAEIVQDFYDDDNKKAHVPQNPLFIGDVMHDFWVQDVRKPENSNKFSELVKGKKFVFMDFFHVNCSWCTTHMKTFLNIYKRDLYKYHDEMLVIMVDVQKDSDDQIKYYCTTNNIPEEFVVCNTTNYVEGRTAGRGILSWFETDKGYLVATPGHVWLDSEGVIYDMKVYTTEQTFRDMINGYYEKLNVGEAERKFESTNGYTHSKPKSDAQKAQTVSSVGVVHDDKRKYLR